ncbi:MAG TPA: DUF2520 domain-containing protein [Candidatus Nitrosotalea sp.]|nr:DUF2520 domain-containing protein [Candidatus Nitrosotalea sp.]
MRAALVLGRGALGRTLAGALDLPLLPGRSTAAEVEQALTQSGSGIVLLALPDSALAGAAAELALIPPRQLQGLVHLAGGHTLEVLRAARDAGHPVGSMHPLQAFSSVRSRRAFAGVSFAVDASSVPLELALERMARRLGGTPHHLAAADRPLYHAAAVLAGNGLVALAALARDLLCEAGWSSSDAVTALVPLMRGALDGLDREGLPAALSGPLRRGEEEVVRLHLGALSRPGRERARRAYQVLGLSALDLARELGLEPARGEVLQGMLEEVSA